MDGIRSRPPGPSGLPDDLALDGFPDGLALDGLPRPGIDVGPGAPLPPVPGDGLDGPGGWRHRDDVLDLADGSGTAFWAYGGQSPTDPLGPGDGLALAAPSVDVAGDLAGDLAIDGGWDPGRVGRLDDDLFTQPLPDDGLLITPFDADLGLRGTDAAVGLSGIGLAFDATNPLDGVEPATAFAADELVIAGSGLAALAPPLPPFGSDELEVGGIEGPTTLFPEMYRVDPLDGTDPAPGAELPPLPDLERDGITFATLVGPAGEPDAPFTPDLVQDFVRDDDGIEIAPDAAAFATTSL